MLGSDDEFVDASCTSFSASASGARSRTVSVVRWLAAPSRPPAAPPPVPVCYSWAPPTTVTNPST